MKRYMLCYFSSVGTLMLFTVFLMTNVIPMAVLSAVSFAVCLVWFCKIIEQGERWNYRQIRRFSQKLNDYEKEIRRLRSVVDGKVDKKIDINVAKNVKPGSRPSIEYKNMIVQIKEEEHEIQQKDKRAEEAKETLTV